MLTCGEVSVCEILINPLMPHCKKIQFHLWGMKFLQHPPTVRHMLEVLHTGPWTLFDAIKISLLRIQLAWKECDFHFLVIRAMILADISISKQCFTVIAILHSCGFNIIIWVECFTYSAIYDNLFVKEDFLIFVLLLLPFFMHNLLTLSIINRISQDDSLPEKQKLQLQVIVFGFTCPVYCFHCFVESCSILEIRRWKKAFLLEWSIMQGFSGV